MKSGSLRSFTAAVAGLAAFSFTGFAAPLVVDDDFATGTRGWTAFFVDHPPGVEADWDFDSGLRPLPQELGLAGNGFMITGDNHSDDLGMALKKRLTADDGVEPSATYWVDFEIIFASNAASGSFGVGGSPGDGVYVKAGASATEPDAVLDPESDHLRPTVNVGFQSVGGPAATPAGTIANGRVAEDPAQFVALTRTHRHRFPVRAGADGTLWLLVMTDSAFEGPTTLYYLRIRTTLTPVEVGDGQGLVNLSTRAPVRPGDDALIAGYALDGLGDVPVLVRAVGPGLAEFNLDGLLPDPRLEVIRNPATVVAQNDTWTAAPDQPALRAAFAEAGAFPLPEPSADAAVLTSNPAGLYSAVVRGAGESEGIALVEVYRLLAAGGARLSNLSTRGLAGSGSTAMIAGLTVAGPEPERVLIRAIGPGLTGHGVTSAAIRPIITLHVDDEPVATNSGWDFINPGAEIAAAAQAAGAFALEPGSLDAALLVTLPPQTYTIVVEDGDTTAARTALVEVYRVP